MALPQIMKQQSRWLVWRSEMYPEPGKKPLKVPYIALPDGLQHASVTDSSTWKSYSEAMTAFQENSA